MENIIEVSFADGTKMVWREVPDDKHEEALKVLEEILGETARFLVWDGGGRG
jgi:hypothetical protein